MGREWSLRPPSLHIAAADYDDSTKTVIVLNIDYGLRGIQLDLAAFTGSSLLFQPAIESMLHVGCVVFMLQLQHL